MQIDIFTLCDNAQNYDGKAVIVGTFNQINSNKFPFVYTPSFSIVGRIGYEIGGEKDFKLSFLSPEGKLMVPPFIWKTTVVAEEGKLGYIDFNLLFNQIHFDVPGTYIFRLESDDIQRELPLYLMRS